MIKTILLLLTLIICSSNAGAVPCFKHTLTVARHVEATISEAEIDELLNAASTLLQTQNSDTDVFCCVELVREGSLDTFGSVGDGLNNPDTLSDIRNAIHASDHKVKIVTSLARRTVWETIFGSGEQPDVYAGQAYPGLSFLVIINADASTWAHEFGHTQQIWLHSDNPNSIMANPASLEGEVNEDNCKSFKNGGEEFEKVFVVPNYPPWVGVN